MKVQYLIKHVSGSNYLISYMELKPDRGVNEEIDIKCKIKDKNGIVQIETDRMYTCTPYPSFDVSGSLAGMRANYSGWGKAKVVKAHGSYHNTSVLSIQHPLDLLAYLLEYGNCPYLLKETKPFEVHYEGKFNIQVFHHDKLKDTWKRP